MKRILPILFATAVLAGCQDVQEPLAPEAPETIAAMASASADGIPGQYIVVFSNGVADAPGLARQMVAAQGGELRYTYSTAIKGFSANLSASAVQALQRNPNVAYIEQDQRVYAVGTQTNATWGLDRVDQRDLPLDATYTYPNEGAGATAYIIDTGIRTTHVDFGGRATHGYDAVDNDFDASDCNGHGTHVAGTVGGSEWGVAKGVALVAVRVLDCQGSGTVSGVIAGVDWVTQNASGSSVANMSLGGGSSSTLDDAVRNSIASGVSYAVAAGNGDFIGRPQDACDGSPSGVLEAMTVGSTTSSDTESSFSNYGTCVDILAPGSSITSAWIDSDTDTNTISGTSMATPHVAGAAALYLTANPGASPASVSNALTSNASVDKIDLHSSSESGGTPNLLLFVGFIGAGDGGGDTNAAPSASFTFSCTDLSCSFTDTSTDSDGTITGWSWNFGDGATATTQHPSHTYAAGGTYTVSLTVTDDAGATSSTSQSVTVSAADTGGSISLSVSTYKTKGLQKADLTWSGATSTNVDIHRDGSVIATTANDGFHTDNINNRGGGSYVYKVCEAGTTTCSDNVTATF